MSAQALSSLSTGHCVLPFPASVIFHMRIPGAAPTGEIVRKACRLPYTLKDEQGRVVAYDKHQLSVRDNNQSTNLRALVEAGVRSFKIERRYKDMRYVKNITAHYRQLLDEILAERPDLARASSGYTQHFFVPDPDECTSWVPSNLISSTSRNRAA